MVGMYILLEHYCYGVYNVISTASHYDFAQMAPTDSNNCHLLASTLVYGVFMERTTATMVAVSDS